MGNLNAAVGCLHQKADRLEAKLDQHMPATAAGFQAVLQGIGVVGDAVNRLEGKADRLEAKADATAGSLQGLHGKADRLEGKADRIEAKLDAMAQQNATTAGSFASLVNTVIAKRVVDVQAIEIKSRERWLLSANEAGQAVSVALVSVKVSEAKNNQPLAFTDVTANSVLTSAGPGLYNLQINLPNGVKDAKLFEFRVRHADSDPVLGPVTHWGVQVSSHKDRDD